MKKQYLLILAVLLSFATGCVGEPEEKPEPKSDSAELSLTGNLPYFGGVILGTNKIMAFKVTNVGAIDAIIPELTSAGVGLSAEYSVVGGSCQPGLTLESFDYCTIMIRFTPTQEAHVAQELALPYNNGISETPVLAKLVLDGYGVLDCDNHFQPQCPTPLPALSISDAETFDYQNVAIGATSEHEFTVKNTGKAVAILGNVSAADLGLAPPFTVIGGTCTAGASLAAYVGSCTLIVRYTPMAQEDSNGTITLAYSAPTGQHSSTSRAILGSGVLDCAAYPQPECPVLAPAITISDGASYDFGNVPVGATADHTFTVSNMGTAAGVLGTMTTAGLGLSSPFTLVGGTCASGASIAAAVGTCSLIVRYTPTWTGSHAVSIDLIYSDAVNNYHALRPLTGTAVLDCVNYPAAAQCPNATPVYTRHYNLRRTGLNDTETQLTTTNVNAVQFGKLFSYAVDGQVYAQPLFVPHLNMPGVGYRNVLFIATEHDSVYAFDADNYGTGAPLWQRSFIDPANGITTVPSTDVISNDIKPEIGITGTPVIDPATKTLYVVAKTKENGDWFHRLHALDLLTGAERPGSPVEIQATYSGSGSTSYGTGIITMYNLRQNQRPALVLSGGIVYVAFASHGDNTPYHGFLLGYNAATLSQVAVFSSTPDGQDGSIWMDGMAPAVDTDGSLLFATGNGTTSAHTGGLDYADTIIRLFVGTGLPRATGFSAIDYFLPYNYDFLNVHDVDLGAGGIIAVPDLVGNAVPHVMVAGGKNGSLYVLNRDNLGGYNPTDNSNILQEITNFPEGIFCTPAYWQGNLYLHGSFDVLKSFRFNSSSQLSLSATGANNYVFPGATPTVSSNGATNGIVWELDLTKFATGGAAVLHAYDGNNVANELYNSAQASGGRDTAGPAVKFTSPVVTNGKVYVGGGSAVTVYGLF